MRPRDFIHALEHPESPRCGVSGEQADILRTLLVHLFFVDLDLDHRELALLARVLPEGDASEHVRAAAARKLNLIRLAELFPDRSDRDDILTLAEHAVWGDGQVKAAERDLLGRLTETLGVVRP